MIKITGWHDSCCPCEDSQRKQLELGLLATGCGTYSKISNKFKVGSCLQYRSSQSKYELEERRQMAAG